MGERLLVLDAGGSVPATSWAPKLAAISELVVVYVEDWIEAPDTLDAYAVARSAIPADDPGDLEAVALEVARDVAVNGVLTFSELALSPAARIAERLGLPHHPPSAIRLMQEKDHQRDRLAAAGIPVPRRCRLSDERDLAQAAAVGFPAVLKPVQGFGSLATVYVESIEELTERLAEARGVRQADWRVEDLRQDFLLEEYIPGTPWSPYEGLADFVSVESLVFGEEILHVTVTDKFPQVPPFRETGDLIPSTLSAPHQHQVLALATEALRALGARDGATHTEIKLTDTGPRIIEVNGRIGGYLSPTIEAAFGYDVVRGAGLIALGHRPEPVSSPVRHAADYEPMTPAEDVRLVAVEGAEEVRRLPGVTSVEVFGIGGVPAWRAGGGCYAYVTAVAEDPSELIALRARVERTLQARFEQRAARS